MDPQLQNWHNFCRYHLGDWYGTNTRYSPEGEIIRSWQVITSLQLSANGDKIYHQDRLMYTDGNAELKTFEPYNKPILKSLFLDNSFFWGSQKVEDSSTFVFEIGFRVEDWRLLAFTRYDESGKLQYITVGAEHLKSFAQSNHLPLENQLNRDWRGVLKKMTTDFVVSQPVSSLWQPLEDLQKAHLVFNLNDNTSISCPQYVRSDEDFFIAVDWLSNSALLHRGIGYYNTSGFNSFSLEVFTPTS
ncbi:DUF3598 family protein [Lyngbya aestuarii]|uniref:DUF3598 family protein n=1 Tax=Lyngbya aestuarii TaxID=118322 RepID=UPI00403DCE5A